MSNLANEFKTDYKIQMPLSGVAMSSFERNGTKFAYLDYDVKKGLKWNMKFYWDKEKAKPFFDVDETKNAWLSDSGYEIKDAASGQILGAWVPKKRLLRWFLRQTYTFVVNGKVVARSPGDSCLKVIAAETGRSSRESLTTVVLDDAAPIEVRLAAIRKVELSRDAFMKLLKRAGDDGNPMRTEYDQLIKAYLDAGNAGSMNVANAVCGKYGMRSVPLSVRERLFSWLKDEESIQQILSDIAWDIQDALTKAPELEDVKFAKYLFMHAKQESLAKFVQRHKHNSQIEAFLVEAVNNISDDTLLEKIAESSSIGDVILAAARRVKGPSGKFLLDKAEARYESDIQKRVDALLRVYAVDPKGAYSIVCFHDGKIVNAITDKDVLMGLFKLNQDDKGSLADDVERHLKDGIYKVYEQQIVGLSKDRLDEIVALTQNHANMLAKGGKACVIENYYVGMPLQSFIALNKVQDVKAKALDWKLNAAGKRFVVDGMSFDSRSLFKATGLEKSQVRFDLPRKLGIAAFEIEMTEVKHNRNYFAEAMGSYDFNTVSGGDIYYQSENQAKGVVITVWEKSGRLVMYALGND